MRTSFALDLDLRPISVNAPKDQPHVFRPGDVLFTVQPYDTGSSSGPLPTGTKLFVQHVAEDDGVTWLRAEGDVPALFHWDNMIILVPYDTEDVLPCLRAAIRCPAAVSITPEEPEALPPSNVRPMVRLVALLAILTGLLVPATLQAYRMEMRHATQQADDLEPVVNGSVVIASATG